MSGLKYSVEKVNKREKKCGKTSEHMNELADNAGVLGRKDENNLLYEENSSVHEKNEKPSTHPSKMPNYFNDYISLLC